MVDKLTADATGGVFYFRLEDTDQKREVEGGTEDLLRGLNAYGITPQEGFIAPGEVKGNYGPYRQRERAGIYHVYAKSLVEQGLAYPASVPRRRGRPPGNSRRRPRPAPAITANTPSAAAFPRRRPLARVDAGESYGAARSPE